MREKGEYLLNTFSLFAAGIFAPSIFGHKDIKRAITLTCSLFGGESNDQAMR